jgi:hypothetical protein
VKAVAAGQLAELLSTTKIAEADGATNIPTTRSTQQRQSCKLHARCSIANAAVIAFGIFVQVSTEVQYCTKVHSSYHSLGSAG